MSVLHDLSLALLADRLVADGQGPRARRGRVATIPALHAALVDVFDGAIRVERVGWRWIAIPHLEPVMPARAVMVLGTTSGAGKSWLATALCRWYARQGLNVAPFKAQNMSNNARVVPAATALGEIGSAQYFQALAARAAPDVRMNPVLLKPERDTRSQVVRAGPGARRDLAAMPWRERSERCGRSRARRCTRCVAENDVVVIEGAGSPAEINLHASDYVNMRTAREAERRLPAGRPTSIAAAPSRTCTARTSCCRRDERALIRGFVLNRFRGDAALLAPGPAAPASA